ncbi:MAG: RNA polymerase subunit sigma-24 [Spirochaetales bacterium]|nr:RNA polymerase subunit sigma-24 [Spirochaetales bacterium]
MKNKMTGHGDFDKVYDSVYPLLFKIAYRITGDYTASDDLCQEAFIRYYRRIIPLPSAEQAKYWLIRVVKNLSLNYEKRKGREKRAYDRYLREPKRHTPSGETELMRDESAKLVQEALRQLPFKLRAVIVLREYGNLSYKEIGRIIGISESNVKVRVFRAREQLKKYLDEEEIYVS